MCSGASREESVNVLASEKGMFRFISTLSPPAAPVRSGVALTIRKLKGEPEGGKGPRLPC